MANTNNKISIFIGNQLPEFVREDNELFKLFLEAYYEYMEQSNTNVSQGKVIDRSKSFLENTDIDTYTIDEFAEKLYGEFLAYFPQTVLADKRIILKNAKDFYRSRGSEKSFKFLFQALYGIDADIYIPRNDILIASSGKWLIETSVRVIDITVNGVSDTSLSSLQKFVSTKITGSISRASGSVERVLLSYEAGAAKYEMFLSSVEGTFNRSDVITATNVDGDVLTAQLLAGFISSITVSNVGAGYSIGNPLVFTNQIGDSGRGAAAYISSVSDGGVESIIVNSGGAGFRANDAILFTGGPGSGAVANVTVLDGAANSYYHPNTYNLYYTTINLALTTPLDSANYGFFGNNNLYNSFSNSLASFSFGPTAPIQTITITTGGTYEGPPTADPIGNTWIKSLGVLGRMRVVSGGSGYVNGQILIFTNRPGGSGFSSNGNVVSVNATGSIERVRFTPLNYSRPDDFLIGGMGYDPDHLPLVNVSGAGANANIQVIALLGYGFPLTNLSVGTGTFGEIEEITISSRGLNYNVAPTISLSGFGDGNAQAYATVIQGVYTYPGRYVDDTGFLSAYNFLQDRDYYQNYSYVIKTRKAISDYSGYIKKLLHPSGMKMWGQYMYTTEETSNVSVGGFSSNVRTSMGNGISNIFVSAGGTGYTTANIGSYLVEISGYGSGTAAVVGGVTGGAIMNIVIMANGSGYINSIPRHTTARINVQNNRSGSGATLNVWGILS